MATKPKLTRIPGFEWNFVALSDPATYYAEAQRGYRLKIPGVGRFGVACPKCYLSVSTSADTRKSGGVAFCKCKDRGFAFDPDEIAATLGFTDYGWAQAKTAQVV